MTMDATEEGAPSFSRSRSAFQASTKNPLGIMCLQAGVRSSESRHLRVQKEPR